MHRRGLDQLEAEMMAGGACECASAEPGSLIANMSSCFTSLAATPLPTSRRTALPLACWK